MYITSFVLALLALFGSTASSPARPVHSRLGSLVTAHQLCACLSWWHLKHALPFSQRCLQQPGQHFLRSVDISRHHFTPAFGYVIRLRFQCLGLCSGGSFSPTRRLDATGFLGLGWCCWRSSSSVHQRPISDFPRICVGVYSIALPLYARTLIYVSTPNRFPLPPSAFIARILFAEAC